MIKNFVLPHVACANPAQHRHSSLRVLACARLLACRFRARNRVSHNSTVFYPEKRLYSTVMNSTESQDGMEAAAPEVQKKAVQVSRMREVIGTQPMESAWEQLWKEGITPWDAQGVTPAIAELLRSQQLRDGKALVPGCGSGYDVVAMASATRSVIGLDISESALQRAQLLAAKSPHAAEFVEFRNADFFSFAPPFKFDLVFDYTFFCALDPSLRPRWAEKMAELLALDGELITLMFPLDDHQGGPPFSVSLEAYEKVLSPWGFRLVSCDAEVPSIEARKGLEKLARWERAISKA